MTEKGLFFTSLYLRGQMYYGSLDYEIKTSRDAINLIAEYLKGMATEMSFAIMLDSKGRPICIHVVGLGSSLSTPVDIKSIIQAALLSNATAVILVHSHPDCHPKGLYGLEPSKEDIQITDLLAKACRINGLQLCNSCIVNPNYIKDDKDYRYYSFREKGLKYLHYNGDDINKTLAKTERALNFDTKTEEELLMDKYSVPKEYQRTVANPEELKEAISDFSR